MSTSVQFRLKRRNAAAWTSSNPVLAPGEPGVELDTGRMKIGNGSNWNSTPYSSNVRTNTSANWMASPLILGAGEVGYESDTGKIKIGDGSSLFSALTTLADPSFVIQASISAAAAETARSGAQTARTAAETALGAAAVSTIQTADTIAAGRSAVTDNSYFWVRPVTGSGLTRFTSYKRTSATTQDTVGSVASGTEMDQISSDYLRTGNNLISNSTFAAETPDTGAYTTPTGFFYNNNLGGGKIVTKPNTAINSVNALEFNFASNASSGGFSTSLTQLQLAQNVIIPSNLRPIGATMRGIYNVQLDSTAATRVSSSSLTCVFSAIARWSVNITSASGNGTVITYNCSSDILVPSGTNLNFGISGLPVTTGASLNVSSGVISVSPDKRSFTIPSTVIGTSSGGLAVGSFLIIVTPLRTVVNTANIWQQIISDITIPAGFTSVDFICRMTDNSASTQYSVWITGICADFNRSNLFQYDQNITERITPIANIAVANSPLATTVTNISNSEVIAKTWAIGTNVAPNPLLSKDAVGSTTITGYITTSGGNGTTFAPMSIQSIDTPFNTNVALRITHSNDGSTRTDGQLQLTVSVPTALVGTTYKLRCIYYARNTDSRITNSIAGFKSNGLTALTFTKISTDGAINTWYPVIHEFDVPADSGSSLVLRIVRQQGGIGGSSWGAGVTAFGWITGICVGFNRTNTVFDRNLTEEITSIATTAANSVVASSITARNAANQNDQYIDGSGVMSPIIPIEQIVAWGDSLTAANYISTVISSFNTAGVSRTGLNCGIGGESSTQILNRINGYSYFADGVTTYNSGTTYTLRARRTQPPRLTDSTYVSNWTTFGLTIAEPRAVQFYNGSILINTSYTRLSALSTVTSGSSTLTAVGHPFRNNDIVYFTDSNSITSATVSGTNIFRAKHYFVTKLTNDTYSISETSGGAAVTFNTSGTVTALGDFTLSWTPTTTVAASDIKTLTYTNRDTSTAVIWMGANNINQVATVKSDIAAAVSHFKTLGKRVIILTPIISIGTGTINGTDASSPYNTSSTEVVNRADIGNWIMNTYPNNAIDIWAVLRANGNGSTGDNTDIANGGTPRSLRIDAIHLTTTGYNIVATQVYNLLTSKNW